MVTDRRRVAIAIGATMAGAIVAALIAGRLLTPAPTVAAPPRRFEGVATPRWRRDLGVGAAPGLDLVAHPPIVIGDRVLVAGSRVGYAALDLDRGAIAWRRPGGATLAAPVVLSPHDVVLVRECDEPVAAPVDHAVVACFDRVDPIDLAGRAAGSIWAPVADAAECLLGAAAWQVEPDGDGFVMSRRRCALAFRLPSGAAHATAPAPPDPAPAADCGALPDGTPWCQRVADGASTIEIDGAQLPGLLVLAAARDGRHAAVVVRRDASLRHDELVALVDGQPVWTWPLPEPIDGRAAPIGLSVSAAGVLMLFDTTQVVAFAPL